MFPDEIRNLAKIWKDDGMSYMEIGNLLKISKSAAQNLCKYEKKRICRRRGPKFLLQSYEKLKIKRTIAQLEKEGGKINSVKIKKQSDLKESRWTIQRHLRRMNFKYKKSIKQILLTKRHKENRVNIITQWVTLNHPWELTVFSDEKRFSLDGSDDWRSYTRDGKSIIRQRRVCEGGSVMVWMMMLPNGLLSYRFIDGAFNSGKYLIILKECTVPIIKLNMMENFYFQEDNSPIHTSKVVRKFFDGSNINILKWPARSPDLNIIEDVWKIISDMVYDGPQFQNKPELMNKITETIHCINTTLRLKIIHLYTTIRSRLCIVLQKMVPYLINVKFV